jgi:predicted metal-dependent HD superfamily phosphohydrolase
MDDQFRETLTLAASFSRERFEKLWDPRFSYHNWNHTREVASNCLFIGQQEGLTPHELVLVEIAAWFHDIGHLSGHKNHEVRSIIEVSDFLGTSKLPPGSGRLIENAIMATKVPQSPHDSISKVLCDADLMYLSGDEFFAQAEQLRLEWQRCDRAHLDPEAFFRFSLDFLKEHQYHTLYGEEVLAKGKQRNLARLEEMLRNGSFDKHN